MNFTFIDMEKNSYRLNENILTFLANEPSSESKSRPSHKLIRLDQLESEQIQNLLAKLNQVSSESKLENTNSKIIIDGHIRKITQENLDALQSILDHILKAHDEQLTHSDHQAQKHDKEIIVLFDGLNDAENLGMAFRVADAFAVSKIYLCHSLLDGLNKKIERISRQTSKHIPFEIISHPLNKLRSLQRDDYTVFAIEASKRSIEIRQFDFNDIDKLVLILGSEQNGVSDDILNFVNGSFHLTMYGKNSSMNVIQAMGIALSHIIK